jgi:2'-5' RNA ligase
VSKPPTHRLFFALNPDDRVRSRVQEFQKHLDTGGRAVPAPNFHVTLAFLGMQPPDLIPPVRKIASQLAFEPCRLTLDSIGHFRQAGVLWLGTKQVPPQLQEFQHALVDRLLSPDNRAREHRVGTERL